MIDGYVYPYAVDIPRLFKESAVRCFEYFTIERG